MDEKELKMNKNALPFRMMKYLLILLSCMVASCQNQSTDRNIIENEINNAVIESLTLSDESLLDTMKTLYQKDLHLKQFSHGHDDSANLKSIIVEALLNGDFRIIDTALLDEAQILRSKLDSIRFYDYKHLNFKYLHKIINPILLAYEDDYQAGQSPYGAAHLIHQIGTTDLDKIDFSFTLYLAGLSEQMNSDMFENELYSNIVLLTTYGNFIYYSTN